MKQPEELARCFCCALSKRKTSHSEGDRCATTSCTSASEVVLYSTKVITEYLDSFFAESVHGAVPAIKYIHVRHTKYD
ncbi:hypothetical protein PGTUg99_008900 [Puccinia graminis f. sp. tritici]|uniref:Uncharacterized protein n=1 Tax=Puccinia graminis f. sp. tritici TaxID=56615 RepID=A0A5B0QG95_PUCGR|nr:hypothetical protein PGTUg99_008458 [Puccinia graminis f. sp. tritici]KAA1123438.1 hypothetical protein PGTUg99_008900 [Puccinia graminis f. sp. tritici]